MDGYTHLINKACDGSYRFYKIKISLGYKNFIIIQKYSILG